MHRNELVNFLKNAKQTKKKSARCVAENEVKKNDYYKRDESKKIVVPLFVFSI